MSARSQCGEVDPVERAGEVPHLLQRRLRRAVHGREPEVQLEGVVAVRRLVDQVEVGVVPGDPAGRAAEQAVVQDLPVVVRGVVVGGEVGGAAELLQHHRTAVRPGQLAHERRAVVLAGEVVLHPVDVRPDEVGELGEPAHGEPVVRAGHLHAPGAVADGDRLLGSPGVHGPHHHPRPARDLLGRRGAAVDRHLVGDQPARDRRVAGEAAGHLLGEPRLPVDHPHVGVQVAALAPGGVPVLAGHVADDEGRDRGEPALGVRLDEVGEPVHEGLVDPVGLGHEVGPVEEGPGEVQAVVAQDVQLRAYDLGVVGPPHQRASGPGPEVGAQPGGGVELGRVAFHMDPLVMT